VKVFIFRSINIIRTLILFILLSFNFEINAREIILDEHFKSAKLIEASDIYSSIPLYQDLANKGHTEAKIRLAAILSSGLSELGTKEDRFNKSVKLLHEAADEGSIKAYYGLSVIYHDKNSFAPNADLGMEWLIKAAKAGEPRGQSQLGSLYLHGIFINKDIDKSIFWFEEAIKNNSNSARYNLAKLYINKANITPLRLEKAIELYLAAADQGYTDAKVALGNIYMHVTYGLKNGEKAIYWLKSAAQSGNALGQTGLASCYRYGIGTEIDYQKALYWYQKSSDLSHSPTARYRLAEMYMLGLGTEVDLNKARDIFLVLSQEGYADGTTAVTQIDQLIAAESQ
jgi:TPR repeat protein